MPPSRRVAPEHKLPPPALFCYDYPMSPEVQILPQTLINKIAAGEVIVRPASVVKELIENSFDSGAKRVRVEVSADGRSIAVTDDGCGMDPENAKRAILRHSTSKIREFDDLLRLRTRGFRGEALASIISVSRFEMRTCPEGQMAGTRLVAAGGRVESVEPVGAPPGTAIHVRDLFYNTPARLKFLKSAAAEFNVLAHVLTQQAITRPDVGLACLREGETRFDLPAGQNLLQRIEGLLGSSVRGQMIAVDFQRDGVTVRGYVGRPEAARKDRRWQYLMVNARPISAKQLSYPIQEAYAGLLMTQRFPVVVLDVGLDPYEVDINVHPTKEEVRFGDEKKVAGLLHRAIVLALREQNLMPSLQVGPAPGAPAAASPEATRPAAPSPTPEAAPPLSASAALSSSAPASPAAPPLMVTQSAGRSPAPVGNLRIRPPQDLFAPSRRPSAPAESSQRPPPEAETGRRDVETPSGSTPIPVPSPFAARAGDRAGQDVARCEGPPEEAGSLDAPSGAALTLGDGPPPVVLGQLSRTYILAEWGEDLLLIDQHAAHERLVYRQLRDRPARTLPIQPLLAPIPFEVAAADRDAMESLLPVLRDMGLDVRPEPGGAFSVHALPSDFDSLDVAALVQDVLDDLGQSQGRPGGLDELRERVRVRMACHAAVRAGQALHPREMEALLRRLAEARLSFTCPHGRPTMVLLRKDQLDRQFGRK